MNKEEFIDILKKEAISFFLEKKFIVINDEWDIDLSSLSSIPTHVIFNNKNHVYLNNIPSISEHVYFINDGCVFLNNVMEISETAIFKNNGSIHLNKIETFPNSIMFNNRGALFFENINSFVYYQYSWRYLRKSPSTEGLMNIVEWEKHIGSATLVCLRIFQGGRIENAPKVYSTGYGKYIAYGKTPLESVNNFNEEFAKGFLKAKLPIGMIIKEKLKQFFTITKKRDQ